MGLLETLRITLGTEFSHNRSLRMVRRAVLRCFCLCLVLASVTAIKTLKDIKDLKKDKNLVKEFPRHGLLLLHWFANTVTVDGRGAIWLNFDPGQGIYGLRCSRHEMLHPVNERRRPSQAEGWYYSLGDLSNGGSRMLPSYVTQDFHNSMGSTQHRNMDRVLLKVQKNSPQKVDKVYITQHFEDRGQGAGPNTTYEISPKLILQIQALSNNLVCDADDPRLDFSPCKVLDHQQKAAKVEMVYPKAPGLAWFLALAGYNIHQRFLAFLCSTNPANDPDGSCYPLSVEDRETQCQVHYKMKLEVKTTSKGYARILWSGIPESIARLEVNIGLYADGTQEEPLREYPLNGRTFGSIDTNVPLNPGLQVHLLRSEETAYYLVFSTRHYTSIWKGPEFDDANWVPPARVRGFDMSLQLYTKDGYACARLYVKKSFANWKSVFDNSWVGFYASAADETDKYGKYEWVVNFEKRLEEGCPLDYDVYECESVLAISPGVQARLMLTKHIASEKARTVPWEESSAIKQ
ncbi:uncharacterized protein [Salminus brasiliensis]|uniref:uncharacterized protein n=1 Tax=Salminus brasiliensis TaxID=930266 RepID=UPI003B83733A